MNMPLDERIISELREVLAAGCSPSLNELSTWIDAPYSSVHEAVKRLERAGRIRVTNRGNVPQPLVLELVDRETIYITDRS